MEFALIVLIAFGSDPYSAIEVERYRTHTDCHFQANSMDNHAKNTAKLFKDGKRFRVNTAYVCVPVPK